MEANQYAYQTTAHACSGAWSNGHYDSNCEHGGLCIQNSVDNWNHKGKNYYGPGGQFNIDTTQEFHVKIEFKESSGQFQEFTTTLTQGSSIVTDSCNDGSNNRMTGDLSDSIITLSSWGSPDANWLWKDSCYGSCGNPTLTFKNIAVTTSGSIPPGPKPGPTCEDCQYGDACATKSADDCDGSCDCVWSWPGNDPA